MKLFEHPDFGPIVTATTESLQAKGLVRINEQIVEKDYYVTEVLRIVAREFGVKVLFKGGTSLSKGWNLIQRFSEDVDLFLNPTKFDPPLGESRIRRSLEELRDLVGVHPALNWTENMSQAENKVRADRFEYAAAYHVNRDIPASVLVEAGIRSGDYPVEEVSLSSYVSEYLRKNDLVGIADDLTAFPMMLLHYKRTFVEKLYTIHSKVEIMLERGDTTLGVHARHYYDLAKLLRQPEVQSLLRSDELTGIVDDYYRITRKYFKHSPLPEHRSLRDSRALYPDSMLRADLEKAYRLQCDNLCFSEDYPGFDETLGGFEEIRDQI